MNFELNEDQRFFQETTRRFLESESPLSAVRSLYEHPEGFERAYWSGAAELGWTSPFVPEGHGGGSLSDNPLADLVIVAEEMGRLVAPGPFLPVNVVAAAVAQAGTADQQAAVLPGLAAGETVATWAFAEANDRWDGEGVGTTATPSGGGFVLRGTKRYVEAAASAEQLLVTARSDAGLTQFLVPTATPGVTVVPGRSVDLTRRFGDVRFDGVEVPASAVLGAVGDAGPQVERQLQIALALQVAETAGMMDRVFEFTFEYLGDRWTFGRPLASYQALKHRVADMRLWLETARGCTDAVADAVGTGTADAARVASVAKAYVAEYSIALLSDCVQMNGGIAVTWEHDMHLYERRGSVNRAVYGNEYHHYERLCRLIAEGAAA